MISTYLYQESTCDFLGPGLDLLTSQPKPLLSLQLIQGKVEKLAWAARELCELLRVKVEAGAFLTRRHDQNGTNSYIDHLQ